MREEWRLILSGSGNGAWNMAVDEAIVTFAGRGLVPPTLRLYRFSPPALSVGRIQRIERDVEVEACRALGIDVVRRPTGGRAVLHEGEVTYSFAIKEENPYIPGGLKESYVFLIKGIVAGLQHLGVDARLRGAGSPRGNSPACFDAASWYEVVVRDRKLVGSAQARLHGGFLQHGSIMLDFDAQKLLRLLRFPSEEAREVTLRELEEGATSLQRELGRSVSPQEVYDAIIKGVRDTLGIEFIEGNLTDEEAAFARELFSSRQGRDFLQGTRRVV